MSISHNLAIFVYHLTQLFQISNQNFNFITLKNQQLFLKINIFFLNRFDNNKS